jgi:hypothetical protein
MFLKDSSLGVDPRNIAQVCVEGCRAEAAGRWPMAVAGAGSGAGAAGAADWCSGSGS